MLKNHTSYNLAIICDHDIVVFIICPSYCEVRTLSLMKLLLPDDQSDTVVTMASSISVRMAAEKITQWMNKHITVGMSKTFLKPITVELR